MSYKATRDRRLTPTARIILNYLKSQEVEQSAIEVSDGTGTSYWHARDLCAALLDHGFVTCRLIGKSPFYKFLTESPAAKEAGNE